MAHLAYRIKMIGECAGGVGSGGGTGREMRNKSLVLKAIFLVAGALGTVPLSIRYEMGRRHDSIASSSSAGEGRTFFVTQKDAHAERAGMAAARFY